MKIGILTQPLNTSYGGLLQAFALQFYLRSQGHEVKTINIPIRNTLYRRLRSKIWTLIRFYILKQTNVPLRPSNESNKIITQYTRKFIQEYISVTETIPVVEKINRIKKYNFEAYIVGSDQVWRPKYSPGINTFYLDF